MKHSLLILVLVGLSFALGGCGNKSTRSDESPAETVAPDLGVAPHLDDATGWLAPDTLAIGGMSLDPIRRLMADGMPPDRREARFDAMVADLGRLFEAKTGVDWTKVDAVVTGYGSSWWTLLVFGDFSLDGIQTGRKSIEGQEVVAWDVGGGITGYAVPLTGTRPGYAVFENQDHVTAALKARRTAGDDLEVLAERSATAVTELVAELPASNVMVSAVIDGPLAGQIPPQAQGMMPKQIAVSLGTSTAVLLRGEPERIDALHDFVDAMIEQARAPVVQRYEARGGLEIAEATGAVIAYHYIEAYLDSLQVERGDGSLTYRMTLPMDSQLAFAVPGIIAAVGIPAFQRYIDRSRAARDSAAAAEAPTVVEAAPAEADPSEAYDFVGRAAQMSIEHFEETGTFPGTSGYQFQSHVKVPVGGQPQKATPVVSMMGGPNPDAVLSDIGLQEGTWLSFQYTYEVTGKGTDARATITAVADFKPGGEMHTVRAELTIDPETGQPRATKPEVTAYGE